MWGKKKPDEEFIARPEPRNGEWNPLPGLSAGLQEARPLNTVPAKGAEGRTGATTGGMAAGFGANLHMKGEVTGSQDLVIEGTFEGILHLDEGKLTIGTTGRVTADIVASEVVVWGRVKGNVRAKNRIEIKKNGSVTGDLTTQQIMIEVGAIYKGSIETENDAAEKGVDLSAVSSAAAASASPTAAA